MRGFEVAYKRFIIETAIFLSGIAFRIRSRLARGAGSLGAPRTHLGIAFVAEGIVPLWERVLADEVHGVAVHLEDRRRLLVEVLAAFEVQGILRRPAEVERLLVRRQEVGSTAGRITGQPSRDQLLGPQPPQRRRRPDLRRLGLFGSGRRAPEWPPCLENSVQGNAL